MAMPMYWELRTGKVMTVFIVAVEQDDIWWRAGSTRIPPPEFGATRLRTFQINSKLSKTVKNMKFQIVNNILHCN